MPHAGEVTTHQAWSRKTRRRPKWADRAATSRGGNLWK